MPDSSTLAELAITGFFTVLWWLLKNKDSHQEKLIESLQSQITVLFTKHDIDVAELSGMKLQLAQQHYIKPELDLKFDKIETSIKEGMGDLGRKFDRLSEALLSEHTKK